MGTCDVTFCDNDAVLHQKRFYQKIVQKLLQHESIGNEIYQEESIWSTITKRKLKTFKIQLMMMKKVDVRAVQL